MKRQQNKKIRRLSHLAVNLIIWLSLLSATALLHPTGLEPVQAARIGNSKPSTQAGLRADIPAINIIYVKKNATGANNGASWTNAYTSLQSALETPFIGEGDQIWVAAGVYTPTHRTLVTDTRTATFFLLPDVEVFGGFQGTETSITQRNWRLNPSILSGDLSGNDTANDFPEGPTYSENSYHVVTASTLDKPTRLDGFLIQGGNANAEEAEMIDPFDYGGGLYNKQSEAILVNLIFYKNFAVQGGGLYNIETYSQVINCAFIGNKSHFGGGLRNISSNTTLLNTILVGNSAYYAGAIYNSSSNPTFVNITVAYNEGNDELPEPQVGGILNDINATLIIKNSILWENHPAQIKNESGPTPSTSELYFSLVQDDCSNFGVSCTGISLDTDPLFENLPGKDGITGTLDDNLRLNWASPAIDAGDNGVVPLDYRDINYNGNVTETLPNDLDNIRRLFQLRAIYLGLGTPPIVDMGAYETQATLFLPLVRKSSQ